MYGLLIESIVHYIKQTYGEGKWEEIRKKANISQMSFATHDRYSENVIPVLARAAAEVTEKPVHELMDAFGVCFVSFIGQYGYDRILNVLGRHLRDFLNGLDNLHEYLRFSYPKLRAPSFFCENESKTGLTLHYRSKRRGFLHYVKGQIRQVAKTFYKTDVDIDVVSESTIDGMTHIVYELHFDNKAFRGSSGFCKISQDSLPVSSGVFFELFPFHVLYDRSIKILNIGKGLKAVMPNIVGKNLVDVFKVIRPIVGFTWQNILGHTNNVFEVVSKFQVQRRASLASCGTTNGGANDNGRNSDPDIVSMDTTFYFDDETSHLLLKGQMMYISEWESIIFLATPVMENLDAMFTTGLFINDLSMHDSSRDLVLAGTQQSSELKLALDQEQQKSKILEENMKKLDIEIQRTDDLLYQMIPRAVAERLRRGEPAINTCQIYDNVTILFSDVVGFNAICSVISPMEVVSLLNGMYTIFDRLSEMHNVYKVETVGDAYMVVAGAPDITPHHSIFVCDMALDMVKSMLDLRDPSTEEDSIKIRIGIHSGNVVAGVVGLRMPRFCLFGDSVNTASRMQSHGQPEMIHISQTTYKQIASDPYDIKERGTISIKGKGIMKTYWLLGKKGERNGTMSPVGSILIEELAKYSNGQERDKSVNMDGSTADMRSLYTPVLLGDTLKSRSAMTSACSTPVKRISENSSKINFLDEDYQSKEMVLKLQAFNSPIPIVNEPNQNGHGDNQEESKPRERRKGVSGAVNDSDSSCYQSKTCTLF